MGMNSDLTEKPCRANPKPGNTAEGVAPQKIIGGMFGLDISSMNGGNYLPDFLSDKNIFTANATSVLAILINFLQPRQVWLPSYSCIALWAAISHACVPARFYPLSYELDLQSSSWLKEVRPGDLVVMIDYFGFPLGTKYVEMIKNRGAYILEDATQALLSEGAGRRGDFAIISPRNFLGVRDGGILLVDERFDRAKIRLAPAPKAWWLEALHASILRREFDVHGGSRTWFDVFQEAENRAPVGNFRMSELSRLLLTNCFDYDEIGCRRQRNFDTLAADFSDIALFGRRPRGVVPLAFPVRLKNRDRVRK
jgi:dTDP-4-amino-4,6-dideoxygalactose transaminase